MKYFLDTEFVETRGHIELISVGLTKENGDKLYLVHHNAKLDQASPWVIENVLKPMPEYDAAINKLTALLIPGNYNTLGAIAEKILLFTKGDMDIKFYGYYSDYDWVVFCWIFGTMMELPKGFPKYCVDLKQMMDERGLTKEWKEENCPDPEGEHNAGVDADWNLKLFTAMYNYVTTIK